MSDTSDTTKTNTSRSGSDTGPVSPTTIGENAETSAEQNRIEATRTTRDLGVNSNGDPTIYPSDVEAVSRQYNLTGPEAESLLRSGNVTETGANEIKGARVVYRQSYEQIPATISNPLAVTDQRAAAAEAEADAGADGTDNSRFESAATAPTTDATQPEAGPHGPYAHYPTVDVSAEEIAQQTGVKVEDVDKAIGGGEA